MSRKKKRTISLIGSLVLVLALGGIYFFQQRTEEIVDEPAPFVSPISTLIQRGVGDVTQINFVTPDSRYTMFPDDNLDWYHGDFPDFPLHPMLTFSKIRPAFSLRSASTVHEYSEGLNLADFGLNPPQLTLEVSYTDGTTTNIYIGSHTTDMTARFLMVSDDPGIYTISNQDGNFLFLTIEDMLDRTTLPIDMDAEYILITRQDGPTIELALPAEVQQGLDAGFTLDFQSGHFLQMMQPLYEFELAHWNLESRFFEPLEDFHLMETVSLVPTNLADYGLDVPQLEFVFRNRLEEMHLLFGDTFMYNGTEFIYVKFADRPHVFRTRQDMAAIFFDLDMFMIMDRFIALIHVADMEAIIIESPNPERNMRIDINHFDENNIAPSVDGRSLPAQDFRRVIQFIIGISIEGQIEPFMPTGEPDLTIVYTKLDGSEATELRFFAIDSNFYAVSVNGQEAMFATGQRNLDGFFSGIYELLE